MSIERNIRWTCLLPWLGICVVLLLLGNSSLTQPPRAAEKDKPDVQKGPQPSSYDQVSPVLLGQESFQKMMAKDKADKAAVMARQKKLLEERYDLTSAAGRQGQDDARQADPGRPGGRSCRRA